MAKIGLFFGSFDPIHIGHINVATSVLNLHLVDEVHFIVAYSNPWKPKQTSFDDRVKMAQLAVKTEPKMWVNSIERLVYDAYGITCTYKVIEALKEANKDDELYIITTQETYKEIPHWKNGQDVIANNNFIILSSNHFGDVDFEVKDNCQLIDILDIPICSTTVRNLIKSNSITLPFLDANVDKYIKEHKLYI